ncbi:hypothetical protein MRX96_056591 [Rhipicephalus microplus]
MSNVATPSRDQQQFRTVEPRYLDVDRVDSLASTAALALWSSVRAARVGRCHVSYLFLQTAGILLARPHHQDVSDHTKRPQKSAYVHATAVVHNAEAFYSIRQDYHGQDDRGDYCRGRR